MPQVLIGFGSMPAINAENLAEVIAVPLEGEEERWGHCGQCGYLAYWCRYRLNVLGKLAYPHKEVCAKCGADSDPKLPYFVVWPRDEFFGINQLVVPSGMQPVFTGHEEKPPIATVEVCSDVDQRFVCRNCGHEEYLYLYLIPHKTDVWGVIAGSAKTCTNCGVWQLEPVIIYRFPLDGSPMTVEVVERKEVPAD